MVKRKRESTASTTSPTSQRAKKRASAKAPEARPSSLASGLHPHGDIDLDKEYKIKAIIGERKDKYHIAWEDDSETGEAYLPTWEPKANANDLAVADWERTKAAKKSTPGKSCTKRATAKQQSPARSRRLRGRSRLRPIIESTPDLTLSQPLDNTSEIPEIGDSQQSPVDRTLSESEDFSAGEESIRPPQLQSIVREPTVQVPDPPSSYNRGAYISIGAPHSSSNGTAFEAVDSSVSLPIAVSAPSPAQSTQQESKVVPDSQSQGQFLEDSTFRGFSPTQPQVDTQSAAPERVAKQSPGFSGVPGKITQSSHAAASRGRIGDNEQASGGAEQIETPSVDHDQAVPSAVIPASVQIALDRIDDSESPAPELTQSSVLSTPESVPEPSHDEHLASDKIVQEQQLRAKDPTTQERLVTPQFHSQEESQNSSTQEAQIAEPQIQAEFPSAVKASLEANNYIVVSEEEDPESSLGLLTQPDYHPPPAGQRQPPSSILTEHTAGPLKSQAKTPSQTVNQSDSTQSPFPFETQRSLPTKVELKRARAVYSQYLPPSSARSSSQIPSVPSQSLPTVGESAPVRLSTPSPHSTATMEPNNSLLAMLTAISDSGKARRRARRSNTPSTKPAPAMVTAAGSPASAIPPNVSAEVAQALRQADSVRDGGRSPSTVPASLPEPPITKEEMRTSGRFPTLISPVNGSIAEEQETITVSEARSTQDDPELASVHTVPVPFGNIQRDQYKNGFHWYQGEIQGFLAGDDSSEQVSKAEMALEELRYITIHPDLINSEVYSQPLSTPEQSQWDVDASCKFRFLRDLLEQLHIQSRDQVKDIHVVVAAKGRIVPETLSRFLQGIDLPHTRLSALSPVPHGPLQHIQISVLDLNSDVPVELLGRADVVVAMDGACTYQDRLLQAARRAERSDGDWAALLILVAPCTVEHIERSLLPSIADTTRLRTLLSTARKLQMQGIAGRLTLEQSSSKQAAIDIAAFLLSSTPIQWPIEELGTIDNLDSQTDSDHTLHSSSFGAGKRPLDFDMETANGDCGKKPRVSSIGVEVEGTSRLPTTINPQDMDLTHISDSLEKVTQSAQDSGELDQLRKLLSEKHDELQEHVKVMSELQFRHEDQHVELAKTKKERDEAIITAQTAVARMTLAANQSAELRSERTALKEMVREANNKLLSHEIPERRDFEALRLAMEQERRDKGKAEKRVEQEQKQSEYSREMYQNTSSRARELAQQNAELEARLVKAEKLALGEQAKARHASESGRNKLLAKENKKLRALLVDREAGLKFRDEEIARLKEAGRGRIGTRGSSVPRSPRVGSPALKGRSSRQASPSTGELKGKHLHPLRNG